MVEVGKSEEGLDVFDFLRLRPVMDCLDLFQSHGEPLRREAEAEVFDGGGMELTLFRFSIELVFAEASEDFLDMSLVQLLVLGIDEDVVKVYDNTHVQEVCEDAINKPLESSRGISEAKGHHQPLIGAVAHAEGGLPLIARGDADKVVGMVEIDLGIYFGFGRRVEEVGDERKGILIFLGDFVEAMVVYTEVERAILLFDK